MVRSSRSLWFVAPLVWACADPPDAGPLVESAPVSAPIAGPAAATAQPSTAPAPGRPDPLAAADVAGPSATSADLRAADLPSDAPARMAARHIVVVWQGTVGAPAELRRTRGEAERRVSAAADRLTAGEDFGALAKELSDGPSAPRGGHLGAFAAGAMHPLFEEAAFRLQPGQVSGVVETPFGLHLIQRVPLEEVWLAHIVVQFVGAHRSHVARTPDEAAQRIADARVMLDSGTPFHQVAEEFSDGPSSIRGGDLGWFQRDQMVPQLEDAAFGLAVGEISDVIETPAGLHLLHRLR